MLPVGDLVEPDLQRGEDEEDQPHLGVHGRAGVGVFVRVARGHVGVHGATAHLMR